MGVYRKNNRSKGFTLIKTSIVLVTIGLVIGLLPTMCKLISPRPIYDLLFSIDLNDVPYSDPNSTGIVIRVRDRKANVLITGKTRRYLETDNSQVYVCEAASGKLREIHIPIHVLGYKPLPGDVEYNKYLGGPPTFIRAPELESLTIDNSSVAPNGYTLSKLTFDKTYPILDVVIPFPYIPFPLGKALKGDNYKKCLEQVAGHQVGLTVHFIGWVIP